jgi:hypothetical protein
VLYLNKSTGIEAMESQSRKRLLKSVTKVLCLNRSVGIDVKEEHPSKAL